MIVATRKNADSYNHYNKANKCLCQHPNIKFLHSHWSTVLSAFASSVSGPYSRPLVQSPRLHKLHPAAPGSPSALPAATNTHDPWDSSTPARLCTPGLAHTGDRAVSYPGRQPLLSFLGWKMPPGHPSSLSILQQLTFCRLWWVFTITAIPIAFIVTVSNFYNIITPTTVLITKNPIWIISVQTYSPFA